MAKEETAALDSSQKLEPGDSLRLSFLKQSLESSDFGKRPFALDPPAAGAGGGRNQAAVTNGGRREHLQSFKHSRNQTKHQQPTLTGAINSLSLHLACASQTR